MVVCAVIYEPVSTAKFRLQRRNREFSENFRPKQALGEPTAVGHRKFQRDPRQLQDSPGSFLLFCKTGASSVKTGVAKRNIRHLLPPNRWRSNFASRLAR